MPDIRRLRRPNGDTSLVHGPDDRTPVRDNSAPPWSWICKLNIASRRGGLYSATGWAAGPRLVVTAGHCVYLQADADWVESIDVTFGLAGSTFRQKVRSTRFVALEGWSRSADERYDLGGLLFDQDLDPGIGFFAVGASGDTDLETLEINCTGYPADIEGGAALVTQRGRTTSVTPERLVYDLDTYEGQSGSPLWAQVGGQFVVVGVHTWGDQANNSGVRVTDDVLAAIHRWKTSGQ